MKGAAIGETGQRIKLRQFAQLGVDVAQLLLARFKLVGHVVERDRERDELSRQRQAGGVCLVLAASDAAGGFRQDADRAHQQAFRAEPDAEQHEKCHDAELGESQPHRGIGAGQHLVLVETDRDMCAGARQLDKCEDTPDAVERCGGNDALGLRQQALDKRVIAELAADPIRRVRFVGEHGALAVDQQHD